MTTRPDYGEETRLPAIPAPNANNTTEVIAAIREALQVRVGAVGDGLDRAVTMRDLLNSGLATPFDLRNLGRETIPPLPLGTGDVDPDMPPTPTALEASGAIKYIILTWQFARGYSRLAFFEVWRSVTDNIADAIQVGQTFAPIYADNVGPGKSYYYWVRATSDAASSPFNSLSGTLGQTAIDPAYLIEVLTGQITESQLYQDLGDRIDLIDGPASLAGSVNQRVQAAIGQSGADLQAALDALDAELDLAGSAIVTLQNSDAQHTSDITVLGTRAGNAESSITNLQGTSATQATALTNLTTRVGNSESSITNLNTTTGNQATALTNLTTRVGNSESSITDLETTTGDTAQKLTLLTNTVGGYTTSIQSNTTAVNGLKGSITNKIDNNGYVTGYGLASDYTNGIAISSFIVRADTFAIGSPTGPGIAPSLPFIVRTTVSTINGVTVPIGAYLADAYIANGTITNAKIGNLQVDDAKIVNLSVAKLIAGKLGVGEYIESTNYLAGDTGFRIHGNGNSEFSNCTVRGTVYATAGKIGGVDIYANGLSSNNYVYGSTGWAIDKNGEAVLNQAIIRGQLVAAYGTLGTITAMTALSGTSGARTVMTERGGIVYDSNNTRRCQWGDLSA